MAEDVVSAERSPAPESLVARPARAARPTYRRRFLVAYFLLAAVLGAAAATAVLLVREPGKEEAAAWSAWRPTGDEGGYPAEIASHVASKYKLPSGKPLVKIVAQHPEVQNVAIRWVAIQGSNEISSADNAVMYILCGDGNRCAIGEGKPSVARHRALQRESLELALYTFKYAGFDSVIALLPPTPSGTSSGVLYFRQQDFEPQLDRPLATTLALPDTPRPPRVSPSELPVLRRLTLPHLFSYRFQQAQDGSVGLLLARPPTQ